MAEVYRYGKYIYCIIGTPKKESYGPVGMAGGGEVYTVAHGEIAALVSDAPIVKYRVSRENTLTHQKVLEEVMRRHTLLPVRFGSVAETEKQVAGILKMRCGEFRETLRTMRGKVELGVKAIWKEGLIFKEIVEESPLIQRLKSEVQGHASEKTHYQRIRIGELVEAALHAKREREGREILGPLAKLSVDHRENRILHDRMLLNAAFMVTNKNQGAFDEAINGLATHKGDRVEFKYVGPVPPYNFVNIFIPLEELMASRRGGGHASS